MPKSVQDYLKAPYARILIPDEYGGYSAENLEFPGCFAEGETADEAMQALERAAESWIEAALEQKQEIPEPFQNQGYSGKIALRLPKSLHRKATQLAARDGISLNQFLVSAIAACVGAGEYAERLMAQMLKKLEERFAPAVNPITNFSCESPQIYPTTVVATSGETLASSLSNVQIDRYVVTYPTDIPTTPKRMTIDG